MVLGFNCTARDIVTPVVDVGDSNVVVSLDRVDVVVRIVTAAGIVVFICGLGLRVGNMDALDILFEDEGRDADVELALIADLGELFL